MKPSNDSLTRAWELLKADSIEAADNPLLENRLMNEMKKSATPHTWKRKLALAAALVIGFLAVGSGIAVAAGYNPFKTLTVFFQDGKVVITDENGNQVSGDNVKIDVKEEGGQKQVTVELKAGPGGTVKMQSSGEQK